MPGAHHSIFLRASSIAVLLFSVCPAQDATLLVAPGSSAASLQVSPAKLDFGPQPVAQTGQPKTVAVSNAGKSRLRIVDVFTSGIDFSQTNDCGKSLDAGGTCSVQVAFKPATTGTRMATLEIMGADAQNSRSVILTGIGQ